MEVSSKLYAFNEFFFTVWETEIEVKIWEIFHKTFGVLLRTLIMYYTQKLLNSIRPRKMWPTFHLTVCTKNRCEKFWKTKSLNELSKSFTNKA